MNVESANWIASASSSAKTPSGVLRIFSNSAWQLRIVLSFPLQLTEDIREMYRNPNRTTKNTKIGLEKSKICQCFASQIQYFLFWPQEVSLRFRLYRSPHKKILQQLFLSILPSDLRDHAIVIAVLSKLKLFGIRNTPACSLEMEYLQDSSSLVFLCRRFFPMYYYDGMMGRVLKGIKYFLLCKKNRVWSMLTVVMSQLVG